MNILICGGAGYVGSHMVKMLAGQGHQVIVFDNLMPLPCRGAVTRGVELVQGICCVLRSWPPFFLTAV